jgi:hypothetical protein
MRKAHEPLFTYSISEHRYKSFFAGLLQLRSIPSQEKTPLVNAEMPLNGDHLTRLLLLPELDVEFSKRLMAQFSLVHLGLQLQGFQVFSPFPLHLLSRFQVLHPILRCIPTWK